MRRYYGLIVTREHKLQIIKTLHERQILAEAEFDWQFGDTLLMTLEAEGQKLRGFVNGELLLTAEDAENSFASGGIGLICQDGRTATQKVKIIPVPST